MGTAPALKDLKLFVEELGYRPKYIAWTVGMNTANTSGTEGCISKDLVHPSRPGC